MPPPFRCRTTKKESRRSPRPTAMQERIETWFDAGAWSEPVPGQVLWQQARAGYPDDARIHVQAGIGYGDIGDRAGGLGWLTTGLGLALRTGDPESALEQLRPLRASCLSALGRPSDEIQKRTAQGNTGER